MRFGTGASPDQRATESQIDDEMLTLVTQLTNEINWYMRERDLTRADLAARMGVSPGRVSQILGGGENLTLRTLAALSTALDARFDVELIPLKSGDTYTPAQAEPAPAANHRPLSRARHHDNARHLSPSVEEVAQRGGHRIRRFLGHEVAGRDGVTADVGSVLLPHGGRVVAAADHPVRAP
jgi:transcriptional regulator with XRE-family HTH domain